MSPKLPEPEKAAQQASRREAQSSSAHSFQAGYHPILRLQRTLGNRQVAQLIKARRLTPEGRIIGGRIIPLQPRLTVGATDDQYEQEADHVARQVVGMPDSAIFASSPQASAVEGNAGQHHTLQGKPLPLAASITPFVQRQIGAEEESEESQDKEEDNEGLLQGKFFSRTAALPLQRQPVMEAEEVEPIQAMAAGPLSLSDSFEASNDVESRLNQSKGGGSQLPDSVRAYMEPRFGVDFSHVRIHTGADAIQMNRDVGAQAFTHGSDIYYGAGSSPGNLELTAHELTHVVQQTVGVSLKRKQLNEMVPSIQHYGDRKHADVLLATMFRQHSFVELPVQRQQPPMDSAVAGREGDVVLEQIAHRIAYMPNPSLATDDLEDWGYRLDSIQHGYGDLDLITVTPINSHGDLHPILAFRGSTGEPSFELPDWIDDANPEGIGTYQFFANQPLIARALASLGSGIVVTGHSLGGALAQITAAIYPDRIIRIVTFQAPGVSRELVERVRQSHGGEGIESTHHQVIGDIVPLGGETHTEGEVFEHAAVSIGHADAHTAMPLAEEAEEAGDNLGGTLDFGTSPRHRFYVTHRRSTEEDSRVPDAIRGGFGYIWSSEARMNGQFVRMWRELHALAARGETRWSELLARINSADVRSNDRVILRNNLEELFPELPVIDELLTREIVIGSASLFLATVSARVGRLTEAARRRALRQYEPTTRRFTPYTMAGSVVTRVIQSKSDDVVQQQGEVRRDTDVNNPNEQHVDIVADHPTHKATRLGIMMHRSNGVPLVQRDEPVIETETAFGRKFELGQSTIPTRYGPLESQAELMLSIEASSFEETERGQHHGPRPGRISVEGATGDPGSGATLSIEGEGLLRRLLNLDFETFADHFQIERDREGLHFNAGIQTAEYEIGPWHFQFEFDVIRVDPATPGAAGYRFTLLSPAVTVLMPLQADLLRALGISAILNAEIELEVRWLPDWIALFNELLTRYGHVILQSGAGTAGAGAAATTGGLTTAELSGAGIATTTTGVAIAAGLGAALAGFVFVGGVMWTMANAAEEGHREGLMTWYVQEYAVQFGDTLFHVYGQHAQGERSVPGAAEAAGQGRNDARAAVRRLDPELRASLLRQPRIVVMRAVADLLAEQIGIHYNSFLLR